MFHSMRHCHFKITIVNKLQLKINMILQLRFTASLIKFARPGNRYRERDLSSDLSRRDAMRDTSTSRVKAFTSFFNCVRVSGKKQHNAELK